MKRSNLINYLNNLLEIEKINDISINGLQVEGISEIKKIGLAVDACLKSYEKAVLKNCQILITHHGIIWGGIKKITGPTYRQIKYLIEHKLNLYGAHLPLDQHPVIGNNIQLANILKLKKIVPFGNYHGVDIGYAGNLSSPLTLNQISQIFQQELGGNPQLLSFGKEKISSIGIVSGASGGILTEAIEKNIDLFISGESEHNHHHQALESQINVLYLGHYHSEQSGLLSLGKKIEKDLSIPTIFLDEPTIV